VLVDAHGHIHRFRAVLVAHKDAVLSGICHVDVVDGDGAALGLLSDDELVLVSDLLVVAEPRDLRGRFAVDEARQAQRLEREPGAVEKIRRASMMPLGLQPHSMMTVTPPQSMHWSRSSTASLTMSYLAFHDGDHIRKALSHFGPI